MCSAQSSVALDSATSLPTDTYTFSPGSDGSGESSACGVGGEEVPAVAVAMPVRCSCFAWCVWLAALELSTAAGGRLLCLSETCLPSLGPCTHLYNGFYPPNTQEILLLH